jgi:hypothetical protein
VVGSVLQAVARARHIRPLLYLDAELAQLHEQDVPGVTAYRKELSKLLHKDEVKTLPHEKIISRLNEAGNLFHVLILKSTLTLPYSSVFMQLDCGYWSSVAERRRLRQSLTDRRK